MTTPFSIPAAAPGRLNMSGVFNQLHTGATPPPTRPSSLHTARDVSPASPRTPRASTMRGRQDRHGSLEQNTDVFGRPSTPRGDTLRRDRSPEDRQSRERERRDWRSPTPQGTPGDQPAGFGSRMLLVENSPADTDAIIGPRPGRCGCPAYNDACKRR